MINNIDEIYNKIPASICEKGCFECCTNMIQFSPSEMERMGNYEYNGICSHLKEGKCSIYENRPFLCRIYGTSEILKCDDCVPEKLLSETETANLVHQYTTLKKKEEIRWKTET